ncbi:unnamed protein product, partial [Mesorhabditis spiculigera]
MSETDFDEVDDFDVDFDYTRPRLFPSEVKAILRQLTPDERGIDPERISRASQEPPPSEHDSAGEAEDEAAEIPNVYIHVHDEEGRYYTDLTTFHGMRRIFVAQTWASRVFWCVVVINCLVFFMLFSGRTIISYHRKSSFMMKSSRLSISPFNDMKFKLCKHSSRLNCSQFDLNAVYKCKEVEDDCVLFYDFLFGLKHILKKVKKNLVIDHLTKEMALIPMELTLFLGLPVKSRACAKCARILLPASEGGHCMDSWHELKVPKSFIPNSSYTLRLCERLRIAAYYYEANDCIPKAHFSLFNGNFTECAKPIVPTEKEIKKIQNFRCVPECEKTDLDVRLEKYYQKAKIKSSRRFSKLEIVMDTNIEERTETRKIGLIDVLSLIGGATSLFLGCSCVTLMEMFIYIFKSTISLITRKVPERGTLYDLETDLMQSTSIARTRRRAFQTTFQLTPQAADPILDRLSARSISLVPLSPVRRLSTLSFTHFGRTPMRRERSGSLTSVQTLPVQRLEEQSTSREWTEPTFEKRRPPSLRQLRENVIFNRHSSHSIEKIVRNLPVDKRMSMDLNDEGKYLCRQTAVDIPDEELREYFADNGLEYPEKEVKARKPDPRLQKIHAMPSETGSTRSSMSHRSLHSLHSLRSVRQDEVALVTVVRADENSRRRPSKAFNKKMPLNDF